MRFAISIRWMNCGILKGRSEPNWFARFECSLQAQYIMKRSEIPERRSGCGDEFPDSVTLHPGYFLLFTQLFKIHHEHSKFG